MRMLTPWTAAWITGALVFTASVIAASAQIQTRGAAELHAQLQNATPIQRAACWGWGSLLSAGNDPPLRPISLPVCSLLTASCAFSISEVIGQAAATRKFPIPSGRVACCSLQPNGLGARG